MRTAGAARREMRPGALNPRAVSTHVLRATAAHEGDTQGEGRTRSLAAAVRPVNGLIACAVARRHRPLAADYKLPLPGRDAPCMQSIITGGILRVKSLRENLARCDRGGVGRVGSGTAQSRSGNQHECDPRPSEVKWIPRNSQAPAAPRCRVPSAPSGGVGDRGKRPPSSPRSARPRHSRGGRR